MSRPPWLPHAIFRAIWSDFVGLPVRGGARCEGTLALTAEKQFLTWLGLKTEKERDKLRNAGDEVQADLKDMIVDRLVKAWKEKEHECAKHRKKINAWVKEAFEDPLSDPRILAKINLAVNAIRNFKLK